MRKVYFILLLVVLALPLSCIDTKTPEARVALFLTMVKSGNFEDARPFVETEPFSSAVAKKVLSLPNADIIAIVKNSNFPALAKDESAATDEAKMAALKKDLEKFMEKDPNYLIDLTLKELSSDIQSKDIDIFGQLVGEETGEVYVRFSEASKHPSMMIFTIHKRSGDWLVAGMRELITGWLF